MTERELLKKLAEECKDFHLCVVDGFWWVNNDGEFSAGRTGKRWYPTPLQALKAAWKEHNAQTR